MLSEDAEIIQRIAPRGLLRALIIAPTREFALQVGVDNMCILVHAVKRQPQELPLEGRISNALGEVGPSITLASLSEVLAFAVGSFIPMPAVRVFSMFAALAVLVDFLLQVTAFVALIVFDFLRTEDYRVDCVPCIRVSSIADSNHGICERKPGFLARYMKGRYEIMRNYMPKVGSLGLDMMFRTCTVQVNLDFSSEADMIRKFRAGLALQPALSGVGETLQQRASILDNTALNTALSSQFLIRIGVFTAVPIILGFILEQGFFRAMDRFRGNGNGILIATDVAARGLDIPGVRTVIHYQLPHSAEVYVHRSGRTARASRDGCSVALISPNDRSKFASLCKSFSKESLRHFPVDSSYMPEALKHKAKDDAGLACEYKERHYVDRGMYGKTTDFIKMKKLIHLIKLRFLKLKALLLTAKFQVKAVELAACDWIQVDVMDGRFVPNITIEKNVYREVCEPID